VENVSLIRRLIRREGAPGRPWTPRCCRRRPTRKDRGVCPANLKTNESVTKMSNYCEIVFGIALHLGIISNI
jgi:hypothetical protein